ncbi:hypothetical protein BDR22DRAFT_672339 [Usnea florida]
MSALHLTLHDPIQPLESTLSILLNAGDAAYTFQSEIFRHLNVRDVMNLRLANSRLNYIVRGVPMWEVVEANSERRFTRTRPAGAAVGGSHNSTLRLLGRTCGGERLPGNIPCGTGPRDDVRVRNCTHVPVQLGADPYPPRVYPRTFPYYVRICEHCISNALGSQIASETNRINGNRRVRLCWRCQLFEARRHPDGYSGCVCRSLLNAGWMCFNCRKKTEIRIVQRGHAKLRMLSELHRDGQGRKYLAPKPNKDGHLLDPSRVSPDELPCPGCARSFVDSDLQTPHVEYCTSCDGVEVKPSRGPSFHPTKLVPRPPQRKSQRIIHKYAAMPSLDFSEPTVRRNR